MKLTLILKENPHTNDPTPAVNSNASKQPHHQFFARINLWEWVALSVCVFSNRSTEHEQQWSEMASMFSRTGSTSNRRSANMAGTRTRASISRTDDSEAIRPQDSISSAGHDTILRDRSHDKASKRFSNDLTNIDRRTERRTIVTNEKMIRKSPVKQNAGARKGSMVDNSMKAPESPVARKTQGTTEEREPFAARSGTMD